VKSPPALVNPGYLPAPDQYPVQNVCLSGPVPRVKVWTTTPACTTSVVPSDVAPWDADRTAEGMICGADGLGL
jgi:hypothetical protein